MLNSLAGRMTEVSTQALNTPYLRVPSVSPSDPRANLEKPSGFVRLKELAYFYRTTVWGLVKIAAIGLAICVLWWTTVPFKTNYIRQEGDAIDVETCSPFHERGYLHYNSSDPGDNTWRPFRQDCRPSNLFGQLKSDVQARNELKSAGRHQRFEWLRNRTVILIGDSIDRYHNYDFCQILSWPPGSVGDETFKLENPPTKSYYIGVNSPLAPPLYHFDPKHPLIPPADWPSDKHELFKFRKHVWDTQTDDDTYRPMVCEIPKYGFTMVSIFTWGFDPKKGGWRYANHTGYNPPPEYTSRIEHILKPLLQNLASHFKNPLITKPDLIEMNSGFWDLLQWSQEDFEAANETESSDSPIPFHDVGSDRLAWWAERQTRAIEWVSHSFPELETPILWRSFHHVKRTYKVPFARVAQLDQFARYNIEGIKKNNPVLNARLRVDEWGRVPYLLRYRWKRNNLADCAVIFGHTGTMMLGQEHHFRDDLHVSPLPGGVLWGDIILWELRRAVEKRGNTNYNP